MKKKLKIGKGQKLWKESKTVIAGGNMLFSKRPIPFYLIYGLHILKKLKDEYNDST